MVCIMKKMVLNGKEMWFYDVIQVVSIDLWNVKFGKLKEFIRERRDIYVLWLFCWWRGMCGLGVILVSYGVCDPKHHEKELILWLKNAFFHWFSVCPLWVYSIHLCILDQELLSLLFPIFHFLWFIATKMISESTKKLGIALLPHIWGRERYFFCFVIFFIH